MCYLLVVGMLPLPQTRRRCSASSLLHPSPIRHSASRLLEADSSIELTTQLSNALSQTVVACDLYVATSFFVTFVSSNAVLLVCRLITELNTLETAISQ